MKTIFLDRDGVINKDPGGWTPHNYVTEVEQIHFLPGSLEALKLLKENGYYVMLVSNQAGIGKGYYTEAALRTVNTYMLDRIEKYGGKIDAVYYCVHKNEDECDCRKPKTGLIERAAKEHHIVLSETYFVGDSDVDIIAGGKAGAITILVLSGKSTCADAKQWSVRPDFIFQNLLEAVRWILNKNILEKR